MTNDPFLERLNDYLDGELTDDEIRKLQSHVEGCEECRRQLEELRGVIGTARSLPRAEPAERVWDAIAAALAEKGAGAPSAPRPAPGRAAFWGPLYSGLAVAAALLLGLALWLAIRGGNEGPIEPETLVEMVTEELRAAESHYGKAIGGLEQIMAENDGVLSPELASVLNQNLDLIESAIAESRAAISAEPHSNVAQESLLEALRRKVTLLQNTILLINEVRKGQGENAMDLIDEMRKTSDPI